MLMKLLELGPVCLRTMLRVGLFEAKSPACRKLNMMSRRNETKYCNKLLLHAIRDGRSEMFWWNCYIRPDMQLHQAYLMEVVTSYWPCDARTGYETDRDLRPDATLWNSHHVELDMCTMTRDQLTSLLKRYRNCRDAVLIVTISDARAERMARWVRELAGIAFVSTVKRVIDEPHGKCWLGTDGQMQAIKRP